MISIIASNKTGFTLIEILVAITIIGLILATILGTFTGIITGAKSGEETSEIYQTEMAVMDIISSDIRGIFNPYKNKEGFPFRGYTRMVNGKEVSGMDFITTHTLSEVGKQGFSFEEVSYTIKKNRDDNLFSLWRRKEAPPVPPFFKGGRDVPICRIIEDFKLRFIKNKEKLANIENQIPDAVEIILTLNLNGRKETFMTMVRPMINYK